MATESDGNMRVINKEYDEWDRVLANPDHVIMSDDLKEIMGLSFDAAGVEVSSEENKLSILGSPPECATITGALHTLQFMGSQSVSIEVSRCNPEIMQALHTATKNKEETVSIVLTGANGFEADECSIASFGVVKMAPHNFLLTITFESKNVVFR